MLQTIRDKTQGWFATAIIVLVCISFALWGVHYYLQQGGSSNQFVAKVNGAPISIQQFSTAFRQYQQQQQSALGASYSDDPDFQLNLKQQLLQQMVQQVLLRQELYRQGFYIASTQVDAVIVNMPAFQDNGKFSQALFQQVMNRLSFNPQQFYQQLHDQLLVGQLAMGVNNSNFALPFDIKVAQWVLGETRDVGYMILPLQQFIGQVKITDAQIQTYYKEHMQDFISPEQVQLQYVLLNTKDKAGKPIKSFADLSDKLANIAYENPNSLATVSQKLNIPVQATGYFSRDSKNLTGILASADVIKAAFSDDVLNQNYNSDVINLDDGSAVVIRIAERKPAAPLPLADVSDQIKTLLATTAAQQKMQSVGDDLAKQLANGANGADLAKNYQVVWKEKTDVNRHQPNVPPRVLQSVFNLLVPTDRQHPSTEAIVLPKGNLTVVAVYQVQYGDPNTYNADQRRAFEQQIALGYGKVDYALYVQGLIKQAKVKFYPLSSDNNE